MHALDRSPFELGLLVLGFIGQGMFGARTIAQWVLSERQGRVVSPTVFWIFSVIGSSVFLVYGILRHDLVIVVGQTISFYIYVRNLQLKGFWHKLSRMARFSVLLIPPSIWVGSTFSQWSVAGSWSSTNFGNFFLAIGGIGQLLLNFRYFYQWYYSERAHESVLPLGFWVISAVASVMVVVYSLDRNDLVLLVAQSGGLIAYIRNIYIHFREQPA